MYKKIILSAVILVSSVGLRFEASAGQSTDSLSGYLREYAIELYKEGNIDDAVYQLKNALASDPNDETARSYLEKILSEQKTHAKKSDLKQDVFNRDIVLKQQVKQSKSLGLTQNKNWLEASQQFCQTIKEKEKEIDSLNNQLAQLKAKKEPVLKVDHSEQFRLIQNKEDRIQELNNQLYSLKAAIKDKDNELRSLEVELDLEKSKRSDKEEQLSSLAEGKQKQLEQLVGQLSVLKNAVDDKDSELTKLESELELEKGKRFNKEQELNSLVDDKQKQLEQLKSQLNQLEKEKSLYQGKLNAAELAISEKESDKKKLTEEFESVKAKHADELKRKEEDLNNARLDYEKRLIAFGGDLKAKELMIQQLKNDKTVMLEEDKTEKKRQIERVEKLMAQIEDIFPDKQELEKVKGAASREDINNKNKQLDRIDRLMREIEDVLPK